MSIFSSGLKELKKPDTPLYKTPKSVQQNIDIVRVSESGIFQLPNNMYSRSYRFRDINYVTCNQDEQEGIIERYCKLLNTFDCRFKITISNKNKDMDQMREGILLSYRDDGYNRFRDIYNDIIERKIHEGRQGIEQERFLTITIERKNYEEAKAQFATIEATIKRSFSELGSELIPMTGDERLKTLNDFYHMKSGDDEPFSIESGKKLIRDFKNDLANSHMKFFADHYEDDEKYVRAFFIKKYPSSMSDHFITELMSLPVHSMLSLDVVPIPKDLTSKVLHNKYLGIENDIIKQQRVRNRNNDFSSDISYSKQIEKKEIAAMMDDVRENDECMFYVGVTMLVTADSLQELASVTDTVRAIGKQNSVTIDIHTFKQREALNTTSDRSKTGEHDEDTSYPTTCSYASLQCAGAKRRLGQLLRYKSGE